MVFVLFFADKALKDWTLSEKIKSDRKLFRKSIKLRKISLRIWEDSTIMKPLASTRRMVIEKKQRKVTGKREKLRKRSTKESAEAC